MSIFINRQRIERPVEEQRRRWSISGHCKSIPVTYDVDQSPLPILSCINYGCRLPSWRHSPVHSLRGSPEFSSIGQELRPDTWSPRKRAIVWRTAGRTATTAACVCVCVCVLQRLRRRRCRPAVGRMASTISTVTRLLNARLPVKESSRGAVCGPVRHVRSNGNRRTPRAAML